MWIIWGPISSECFLSLPWVPFSSFLICQVIFGCILWNYIMSVPLEVNKIAIAPWQKCIPVQNVGEFIGLN